jgi:outer membrane lipoprotein-sorting protein
MKKLAVALIAFMAVVLSVNAAEISESTKAILTKIEKANASVTTITSPVTETKTMPNGKQFVSNGNFSFSSPSLLAIRYTKPEGDYLIINTEDIAQKKKNGKSFNMSLKKNERMQVLSSTLLNCISGKLIALAEMHNATVKSSEANGVITLTFTADAKAAKDFKMIELTYDKATMRIKTMALTDKNNIVTKYTMDKPQYGSAIDASVFEIK